MDKTGKNALFSCRFLYFKLVRKLQHLSIDKWSQAVLKLKKGVLVKGKEGKNMKKFGVSAVVALLICFVISLSACASSGLGFYVGDYKSQSIKKLSSFSMLSVSGEFEEGEGSLIAFSRERVDGEGSSATAYKVITVYDCTQDKVVGTYEVNKATHDIGVLISKVYDNTVYVIATINTATYEGSFVMYNSNGENLLSTDFSSMSSAYNLLDVIVMESGAYRVQEDGKVVKIFDTSDMTDYNYDIICKIGDYYYAKRTSYSAPFSF